MMSGIGGAGGLGDTIRRGFWDKEALRLSFPLYFTSWFQDFTVEVSGSRPGHHYLASSDGTDMAMMPMATKWSDELGLVANSMPWFGSLGGVLTAPEDADSSRILLLRQAESWFRDNDVAFASINLTPEEMRFLPVYQEILKPQVVHRRRAQVTALPEAGEEVEERLMRVFHPKARNAVRKGLAQGFRIERCDSEEAWSSLVRIHSENMELLGGRAKSTETYRLLRKHAPQASVSLTLAKLGERVVAALLLLRVGRTIEYITPAVDPAYRETQALSALIWTEMLSGVIDGALIWNWGGTGWGQSSLHRFKERLGGVTTDYVTIVVCSDQGLRSLPRIENSLPAEVQDYFLYPFSRVRPIG